MFHEILNVVLYGNDSMQSALFRWNKLNNLDTRVCCLFRLCVYTAVVNSWSAVYAQRCPDNSAQVGWNRAENVWV